MVGSARAPAGEEDRGIMRVQELQRVPVVCQAIEQKMTQVKAGARIGLTRRQRSGGASNGSNRRATRGCRTTVSSRDLRAFTTSLPWKATQVGSLAAVWRGPSYLSPFHNLSSDREQPGCPSLRTSSKHIPIVRTADSTPPLLQRGGRGLLNCARRARPFRGRALREHRAILDCHAAHFLSFIARSTSRLASRLLMDARRSCCFLPLANPSSTLARPRVEK